jgi:diguanylate cyclase (GGDEF)-like protein
LTDFPNRSYLLARLAELVSDGEEPARPSALLLLDLDRFKEINDTFGHQCGDLLLQEVGQRLRDRLGFGDIIARLGGDEFGVLLPGAGAERASEAARTILQALEQPLLLEGQELEVGASIGIALSPDHGCDPDVLMRRADVAMYVAKRGHTRLSVYDPEQDHHSPERLQLVGELRRAIESDGLVLHYQPKVSFRTGKIIGSEALVRWAHPQRGIIAPDDFIPLAENTGLIRQLSRWVLNEALRQCRAWQDAELYLPVSVNLSTRDLLDPTLPEIVSDRLEHWRLAPSSLKLEITESAVMADAERAIEVLGRLRSMGVRISVDDFGTGYSSLSYLKRLPVDELKIDRSFIRQIASDENDVAIVRSTIGLAHDLGLTVVAEGIEDRQSWDVLARLGCDVVQGHYVSRPLTADALVEWLRRTPETEQAA